MKKLLYKRYELSITTEGQEIVNQEESLPNQLRTVAGFRIDSTHEDLAYHRTEIGLNIGGDEVLPNGFLTRIAMYGRSSDSKFLQTGELPRKNGKVKISVKDIPHLAHTFTPYKLWLTIAYTENP